MQFRLAAESTRRQLVRHVGVGRGLVRAQHLIRVGGRRGFGTVWDTRGESPSGQAGGGSPRFRAPARAGGKGGAGAVEEAPPVVALPTSDESDALLRLRHTSAHVMAMAVQRLFPEARVTIGPWIERGFYYDFSTPEPFTDKDLEKIRREMARIVKKNAPLVREELSVEEARRRIEEAGEPYKLEILEGILERDAGAPITVYHIGEPGSEGHWWDLCAGPHVESTGKLKMNAIALESVAGAYWRGDEKREMLQRIYGTAWQNEAQLKYYLHLKAEAKRRDHRRIGKDMRLFSIQEDAGSGLVFWHPAGALMRNMIETFWKESHTGDKQRPYELLYTPHIAQNDLWVTSGHAGFYNDSMFETLRVPDNNKQVEYRLKPMSCPNHVLVYKDEAKSYRQLPVRYAELGTVYRYEKSGTMHGLFRVRGFTQDDGHIFCRPDQLQDEILGTLDLVERILSHFGFTEYEVNLSTRPEKSVGETAVWEQAEGEITKALKAKGWDYEVDEGGGAFYGPKIDVKIQDAIGRKWQCSTVQVDFNLPERFDLTYNAEGNEAVRPIMIHRAIFGSLERFFGILTENYAGDFPLWLAPTQMMLIPVGETFGDYAQDVAATMRAAGLRVSLADSSKTLGKNIREAEITKVPLMAVVGAKEVESNTLSVRLRGGRGDTGPVPVDDIVARMKKAVDENTHTIALD